MFKRAFTLIEIMIVVAIIGLLVITLAMSMTGQKSKAEDARTKSDLERLKIAFEDYYNDNNCYPPAEWFDDQNDCGSNNLSPYLNTIPCSKVTGLPYHLEYPTSQCSSFKLYAVLNHPNDPDSLSSPLTSGGTTYQYGVSSSNVSMDDTAGGGGTIPHVYYCQNIGNCTLIAPGQTCTPNYTDPSCNGACSSSISTCH